MATVSNGACQLEHHEIHASRLNSPAGTGGDGGGSSASSTSSRCSNVSSGVFSLESGCCDASRANDSLTRAFLELQLQEPEGGVESQRVSSQTSTEDDEGYSVEEQEEEEEDEAYYEHQAAAAKRCSSLKSSTASAPNLSRSGSTQQTKKAVRFADSLGLDLTKVRHIFSFDSSCPDVDSTALRRLGSSRRRRDSMMPPTGFGQRQQRSLRLMVSPCFPQPGGCSGFLSRVMSQKVMLERATVVSDVLSGGSINGTVRVCNLHYEKRVSVRVTFDAWRSFKEVIASYQAPDGSSNDAGMSDRFAFSVPLPSWFGAAAGDRAALCVRFEAAGQTYWDSNYGENYAFDCLPLSWDGSTNNGPLASFS